MDLRLRLLIITMVGLVAAAAWTLPEWWAIANPESPIAQGLPGLEIEGRSLFDALPNAEQRAYFELFEGDDDLEIEPQADWALALVRARFFSEDSAAPEATEAFEVPAGASLIATGIWQGLDDIRQAEGDVTMYRLSDGTRLLRFEENFLSSRAPDMHVVFTRNPDPSDERGIGVDYIDVGTLRGTVGAQSYVIPESVDFSRYPVMALYSVEFDQVLATLTIR
ncbi:MAG: DM13 domain-containing protein [Phototrophicaceae bacterium]